MITKNLDIILTEAEKHTWITVYFIGWVEEHAHKTIWRITIFICGTGGWSKNKSNYS